MAGDGINMMRSLYAAQWGAIAGQHIAFWWRARKSYSHIRGTQFALDCIHKCIVDWCCDGGAGGINDAFDTDVNDARRLPASNA